MADQGLITPEEAGGGAARAAGHAARRRHADPAAYFVDAVRVAATRAGIPVRRAATGSTRRSIPCCSAAADSALVDGTAAVEAHPGLQAPDAGGARQGRADYLQGLIVAIDPATGDVRALVGGRNYATRRSIARCSRCGSPVPSFKPIVYATAIADSIPANAIVSDTALAIPLGDGRSTGRTTRTGSFSDR